MCFSSKVENHTLKSVLPNNSPITDRENLSEIFVRRYLSINDKRTVNLLTDNDQVHLERLELSRLAAPASKTGLSTILI